MSKELRRKLKAAREKLGESQSQFAKRLEIPTRTLQKWEIDQATPRGLALTTINEMLDKILAK